MKKKKNDIDEKYLKNQKIHEKETDVVDVYGYTPKPWQLAVHNILAKENKNVVVVVKSKRQCGKTTMIENILLEKAINHKKSISMVISPTFQQARKIYKDIINAIGNSILISSKNETNLEIKFINNSTILFRSAESKDNLRGYTIDGVMCVDEAAFISNDIYGIILPMISIHKAPLLLTSTPRYKGGMYYKYWEMANSGQYPNMYAVDFNRFDTSEMINEEELEYIQHSISHNQFVNEYLGEFTDLNSDLFGDVSDIINDSPTLNNTYYVGIDWGCGSGGDYTAISIFNSLNEMVYITRWNDKDESTTIDYIADIIEEYQPQQVTVEKNSIGNVFYGLLDKRLRERHINTLLRAFNTTNDSKNRIVNQFQLAVQNKEVNILPNQSLLSEMATYQTELTANGKTTYNAIKGSHDDMLMATMIAFGSMKKINNYNIII